MEGNKKRQTNEMSESRTTMQIFTSNPVFIHAGVDADAADILLYESAELFSELPLYHRGNSKEMRRTPVPGILIQRFLPTVYSYRYNRAGEIPGTDALRMRISRFFWDRLRRAGLATCVLAAGDEFALVTEERVPPVEVIVKAALVGTPAHIYHGLIGRLDRQGRPFEKGEPHAPYVRFDYRNPLTDVHGDRLRDEQLPRALAERLMDTAPAERTALRVFDVVEQECRRAGFTVLDFCLFLNESGDVLCGEISPDNMRIKSLATQEDHDKDIWRKSGSPELLLARWRAFAEALEAVP